MVRPDPADDERRDQPSKPELQEDVAGRLVGLGETLPATLQDQPLDVVAGLIKLAASIVGGGSGAFGDFFAGKLFPNTLQERVRAALGAAIRRLEAHNRRLRRLEHRIEDLGGQHIALLQEGLESAARATSDERIALIGAIVGDGLSADELHAEFERSHLRLLNSLTDRDVAVLRAKVHPKFRPSAEMVALGNAEEQQLKRAIHVMAENHLLSLGLIVEPVGIEQRPRLGVGPPIVGLKAQPRVVTPLGRSLIMRLDAADAPVPEPVETPAPPGPTLAPGLGATARRKGSAKARRQI